MGGLLGISSSPIRNSNTDRAVKAVLEKTGMPYEFIKLSKYEIAPCRACLGCVKSNECVVKDDAKELVAKFREADGFVLGAFTPYSSLDARAKAFMERTYCLRHNTGLNAGKPGVAVVTTACDPNNPELPPASDIALKQIGFWMMEEGMNMLGSMILSGNVPCIKCGFGDSCAMSGIKMLHGPDATVASVGVQAFEDDEAKQAEAQQLATQLTQAVSAS